VSRAAVALAAVAALTAGCGYDMGAAGPWEPAFDVTGPLAAEDGAPPTTIPAFRSAEPIAADPVRVVTYNVNTGLDPDALADAIIADPDIARAGVFLIQEEESYPDEPGSRASRLAARLGLGYVYVPAREKNGGTHGLAILSAFPIDGVEKMELATTETGVQRIVVAADIDVGGSLLHVIDVHLETRLNPGERVLQLRPAVLDAPGPVLVAGDFNTNKFAWLEGEAPILPTVTADADQSPVLDSYMRSLGYATPTSGSGPTEHMYGLEFRLDSIYTRGLDVTFGGVARDVDTSDHWPLWMDVRLP
jgi:endonuclease/exonuclease/phosphatase family metal-dependent hydrolase